VLVKPSTGYVKINMDGAFEFKTLTGGTCAVIKSEDGTFLKAMA
jgi:ribonuclease HI